VDNIKTIDARGLSCPEPAMLAREALQKTGKRIVEVLVDSAVARENVSRVARNSGWSASVENRPDGSYRVLLKK